MAKTARREFAVGAFASLALLVLALAVMSVGTDSELFVRSVPYEVVFPETAGLRIGSPVKLAGVQVGSVDRIEVPLEPDAVGVVVGFRVRSEYAARIRTDSVAAIRYLQLVSGEKYVELSAGSPDAQRLPAGSTLEVAPGESLLEQGGDIAQNLSDVTAALGEVLRPLREGEGLLGELIQDPDFGKEGLARLRGTLENLEAITSDLRRGEGLVGRMMTDGELAGRADDLARMIENLERFSEALVRREGALGAALEDGGEAELAIRDLSAAVAALRRTAERLERPEGLLGRILNDPEWSESVAGDVKTITANLAEITDKINRGEGTLGALVNDRVLHDSMEEVVSGVGDSRFARWLIRHYRKKGIRADPEDGRPDVP
jgi:phospholipid/cholesterol/gamma-HCH transport system substrate-binding protein